MMNGIPEIGLILLAIAVWSVWKEYFSFDYYYATAWPSSGATVAYDPESQSVVIYDGEGTRVYPI